MPQPVSDKQRAANRKNSRASTGPKTPAGKRRSARNALKHGLLAKDVVLSTATSRESQSDFDKLLADLIAELQPQGFVEETLVERIATSYWRLRRAQRFESGTIRTALEAPDETDQTLIETRQTLAKTQASLAAARRLADLLTKSPETLLPSDKEQLHSLVEEFANPLTLDDDEADDQSAKDELKEDLPETIEHLQSEVAEMTARLGVLRQEQATRDAHRGLTASLPDRDAVWKVVRYETMLDRQLHRAFAELRCCRSRRRNRSAT